MEEIKTKLQKIMNIVSALVSIMAIVYFVFKWSSLPDTIPVHYNLVGEVDRMGSKNEMILIPIFLIVMNVGFYFIGKFPQMWNTGIVITETNRMRVYTSIRNMLSIIRLIISLLFSYMIVVSLGVLTMENWAMVTFIIVIATTIIYYMVKILKKPKNEKE